MENNIHNSFRVGNLAQLSLVMYCWRLGALFQGPGFEPHWGVLFISHSNSLASDSREFISSDIYTGYQNNPVKYEYFSALACLVFKEYLQKSSPHRVGTQNLLFDGNWKGHEFHLHFNSRRTTETNWESWVFEANWESWVFEAKIPRPPRRQSGLLWKQILRQLREKWKIRFMWNAAWCG